jgi:hypothetical protein
MALSELLQALFAVFLLSGIATSAAQTPPDQPLKKMEKVRVENAAKK